jgi:hypothetical protein
LAAPDPHESEESNDVLSPQPSPTHPNHGLYHPNRGKIYMRALRGPPMALKLTAQPFASCPLPPLSCNKLENFQVEVQGSVAGGVRSKNGAPCGDVHDLPRALHHWRLARPLLVTVRPLFLLELFEGHQGGAGQADVPVGSQDGDECVPSFCDPLPAPHSRSLSSYFFIFSLPRAPAEATRNFGMEALLQVRPRANPLSRLLLASLKHAPRPLFLFYLQGAAPGSPAGAPAAAAADDGGVFGAEEPVEHEFPPDPPQGAIPLAALLGPLMGLMGPLGFMGPLVMGAMLHAHGGGGPPSGFYHCRHCR